MHYHAGKNIPGYLPGSDVATFDTFEGAKSYMISELDRDGDSYFDIGENEDERGTVGA